MINKPLMYQVKLGMEPKYILFSFEKLNAKNDAQAKEMAQKVAKLEGYTCYETLAYREGKDIPERI